MKCTDKIKEIQKVFDLFHKGYDIDGREFDMIDAMMKIEEILKK